MILGLPAGFNLAVFAPDIEQQADALLKKLRSHGVTVYSWPNVLKTARLGTPIISILDEAVRQADKVIIIFSAGMLAFPEYHRIVVRCIEYSKRMVPIRLIAGTEPPIMIADLRYVDLADEPRYDAHWANLLRALQK